MARTPESLHAELERIVDEAAIRRLALRYIECADSRNGEDYVRLFAPDAVIEWRDIRFDTPEKIGSLPTAATRDFRLLRHAISNHVIRLDGDQASGTIYCTAFQLSDVAGSPNKYGTQIAYLTYHDRYVRGGELGWLFAYRRVAVDFLQHVVMETRA